MVGNLAVRTGFSPSQSGNLFHSRRIASQEGEVVTLDPEIVELQFAIDRQLKCLYCFVRLAEY